MWGTISLYPRTLVFICRDIEHLASIQSSAAFSRPLLDVVLHFWQHLLLPVHLVTSGAFNKLEKYYFPFLKANHHTNRTRVCMRNEYFITRL